MSNIKKLSKATAEQTIALRRHLHRCPETGFNEIETANQVTKILDELGIPTRRVAVTGVVGVIKGSHDGPTIGLRADMDALEIEEDTGLDFASQNRGVMHACGHDAHTAMLLNAARVLSRQRSDMRGTVKLFFQPAEELDQGALAFLKAGECDDLDAGFAVHVSPDLPAGRVSVEPGGIMASSDAFAVRLKGKGGHGAVPHQGIDAVVAAAALVMNLQSLVSREYDTEDPLVVTVGSLHAGTGFNILAEEAQLSGTIRTFNPDIAIRIPASFERVVRSSAETFRVTPEIEYTTGCRVLENDAVLTGKVRKAVEQIFGVDGLARLPRSMAGEDFAFFGQKCPLVLAWLGVGHTHRANYPLHNPRFNLNEVALWRGVGLYAQVAWDLTGSKK